MAEPKKPRIDEDPASFGAFIAKEGARIVDEVHQQAIAATASEAANDEKTTQEALAVDALDEMQIADELSGRVITEYFYSFPLGGRTVTGLSLAGVKAIAREMGRRGESLTIEKVEFQEDASAVDCIAQVRNLLTNEVRFGHARQAKVMHLRSGGDVEDPFAKTKALNKSQRNALRQFIPEVVIAAMYKEWQKVHGQ